MRAGLAILLLIIGTFFLWEIITGQSRVLIDRIRNPDEYGGSGGVGSFANEKEQK